MKILFLHLSDTHFTNHRDFQSDISNISKALNQMGKFEECIIFYTGDVSYSGSVNEFKNAGVFLRLLIDKIKKDHVNRFIPVYVIPGNHDIENIESYYTFDEIVEAYNNNEIDTYYKKSKDRFNNFYEFSRRNKCFIYHDISEYHLLKYGEFLIKINIINTAPFSLYKSKGRDKSKHYIASEDVDLINRNKGENFSITLMHHGPEWFSEECKHLLNSTVLESTDLLMLGHEHYSKGESKIINVEHQMSLSRGVALYNAKEENGFNAILLDTEAKSLHGKKFVKQSTYYKPTNILESNDIPLHKKGKYTFNKEFREYLLSDVNEREGEKIYDYFVFPTLRSKSFDDTQKKGSINDDVQFIELLKDKKKISIEGGIKKGKTTLAKHLCNVLSNEFISVLLDDKSFAHNPRKILQYQISNQFTDSLSTDEFEQANKDQKVLIIDNVDKIPEKKWNDFYEIVKDNVEYIILLSSTSFTLDIKGRIVSSLMDEDFYELQIEAFYYEKRLELINRICNSKAAIIKNDVKETARRINNEITNQIRFFNLTPDFIHQYVECFLNAGSLIKGVKYENVFNKVYEANLILRLSAVTDEELVPDIMTALDFLASNAHFSKMYPFSVEAFVEAIQQYNDEYDNNLNAQSVKNIAIKARIIREVPGEMEYEFCDNNLLAYFTANHLHRVLNEGTGKELLDGILNNISEDINGDILLFLSYITDNVKVLSPIIEHIDRHMGSWTELNIDEKNIEYLAELKDSTPLKVPTYKEKKEHAESKADIEKDIKENKEVSSSKLYSKKPEEADEVYIRLTKAIKYLELTGKILPGFSHILKGDAKNRIVDILYRYPNKLLYEMLVDIDENHNKLVEEILKDNPKTRQGELITRAMIEKELINQSVGFILSIYDFISNTAATTKTLERFNQYDYESNTNYKLQNLLMEENSGKFDVFLKKAETIFENTELDVVKRMAALIVRKYYLCHDDAPTVGNAQRVLDKLFEKGVKKQFLLEQSRRKSTKK